MNKTISQLYETGEGILRHHDAIFYFYAHKKLFYLDNKYLYKSNSDSFEDLWIFTSIEFSYGLNSIYEINITRWSRYE